jgi:uncharacterized repeat protein (TIGR02543 family)
VAAQADCEAETPPAEDDPLPADPVTYSLKFDGNGADSGATASIQVGEGDPTALTLPDSGFTRAGWKFTGWNTAADGSGFGYQPGDLLMIDGSDTTLYARWQQDTPPAPASQQFIVTFDGDGADSGSTASLTVDDGDSVTLPANGFTRAGRTFIGWNTVTDGNGGWQPGGTFLPLADTTLYAQWDPLSGNETPAEQTPIFTTAQLLPGGTIGVAYSVDIHANGVPSTMTYTVASGSTLPDGLTLNPTTGVLSGTPTPTIPGWTGFEITATNAAATVVNSTTRAFFIYINHEHTVTFD